MKRVRQTIVAVKKQKVLHTCILSVSVALVIQHAMGMRRIILPPVVCLALPYFTTLSHKRYGFRGRELLIIKHVLLIHSTNVSVTFLDLRKIPRDAFVYVHRTSCKESVILVRL
jgi:hypothetical protein